MTGKTLSLILLPTLSCNAACSYCFENKGAAALDMEKVTVIAEKVFDYMDEQDFGTLLIYWQGGELMTMPAVWFEEAGARIERASTGRNKQILHFAQSNMIGYTKDWERLLLSMFGGGVGTSMDYPNLFRSVAGGTTLEYSALWRQKVSEAKKAGIHVGVISVPNLETIRMGAKEFYSHFVEELQITDFQINLPFPGGPGKHSVTEHPLETNALTYFLLQLFDVWMEQGFDRGVTIGPFDKFLELMRSGSSSLPCIWRENCSHDFLCIDPAGNVAQCDCWVASYPEHWFGNILQAGSLAELFENSMARREFRQRPSVIIQQEECLDCEYLSMCHGGCPIRAFSVYGNLYRKDPYCDVYRVLFRRISEAAIMLAEQQIRRNLLNRTTRADKQALA